MVTGLLNGSSSMIPLFFKSRGVGLAAKHKNQSHHLRKTADGELIPRKTCPTQNSLKNSHFLSGFRLRLMGGGVTSLSRPGL